MRTSFWADDTDRGSELELAGGAGLCCTQGEGTGKTGCDGSSTVEIGGVVDVVSCGISRVLWSCDVQRCGKR